jgi:hypothetical protein
MIFVVSRLRFAVRLSIRFRPIFMQSKPGQIITNFGPDTAFEIVAASKTDTSRFQIDELLVLPIEELPTRISLNLSDRKGIPFSAIND